MRLFIVVTSILLLLIACSSSNKNGSDNVVVNPLENPDGNAMQPNNQLANEIINDANYEQVLKDAVRAINLVDIESFKTDAFYLFIDIKETADAISKGESLESGLAFLSEVTNPQNQTSSDLVTQQYACAANGYLTIDSVDYRGAPYLVDTVSFDSCEYGQAEYSGSYKQSSGRRSDRLDNFQDFTRTKGDASLSLTGDRKRKYINVYNAEDLSWNNLAFRLSNDADMSSVTDMEWRRTGFDSLVLDTERYNVVDLEGRPQTINSIVYKSEISADFKLSTEATEQNAVTVSVEMNFRQDYFSWSNSFLITSSLPEYPVADLGSPLVIERPDATRTFDNLPRNVQAQWQTGAIRIEASDGSSVVLQPSPEDVTKVLIELNQSGEQVLKSWSEGYAVDCAEQVAGCGVMSALP